MVKDQFPDAVKEATNSVLPIWLDALKTLLNVNPLQDVENTPNWDGLAIRIQVFKVCANFMIFFVHILDLKFTLSDTQYHPHLVPPSTHLAPP